MAAQKLQVTITDGDPDRSDLVGGTMLSSWDIVSVAVYFLLVMGTGIYSMCRPNRGTVAGYFLAGRFMWWLPAMVLLQLLGWVFLPVFIASGVSTLPEYTKKRFGGRRIQTYLAVLSLILYIFTKISVNLYSGAIFIQQALRVSNIYMSIIVLLMMTAMCTLLGGLAAVMYTDTLQFFIMIGGSLYVMIEAFKKVGGYAELQTKYLEAIPEKMIENSTCGLPRVDSWRMLRDADPSVSDMPWVAFLLGQMPVSIWYWCADQMMVQRVMAARSLSHAKGGTIFAGYAKILPLFIIIFPGMISRVLFPNEVGCIVPEECYKFCGSRVSCSNSAYPKLVLESLPSGMRGVMLSVMLSALMTDLTSIFNSASTLFTMDIWPLCRPKAKAKEQLLVGRLFIIILVAFSIMWIPIIERTQGGQLYIYIQAIAAYLAPPIAAIYCLAIIWKRINESGAFWSLITGFVIGLVRMILDFFYGEPSCSEEDYRPLILQKFHFMYFATFLFWLTVLIAFIVSMITKPPPSWMLIRTTFFTRYDQTDREDDIELREKAQNELLQDRSQDPDNHEEVQCKLSWYVRAYNWLLGFDDSEKAQQQALAMNEHIAHLTILHQEPWENNLLNALLVVIIIIALVFYTFFSINPFTIEEVHDIQHNKLHKLGYDNIL
ncbi:sodium/glucose cotransporter 5-like isoform X3 [Homarus americanus]|uniref:sodium/glucose cotransporter 5-like isoform X3 n=1 Tax=Homarus americanus TaxID=6706 RepID=UPI001C48EB93|nr:sodium/glucose cotransporter 5-like isoform X3 [Homarus americanus]